jgi:hypothetical protein
MGVTVLAKLRLLLFGLLLSLFLLKVQEDLVVCVFCLKRRLVLLAYDSLDAGVLA